MIVKSLHDDLAWAVQRLLVNTYFKAKEQAAAQVEETTVTPFFFDVDNSSTSGGKKYGSPFRFGQFQQIRQGLDLAGHERPRFLISVKDGRHARCTGNSLLGALKIPYCTLTSPCLWFPTTAPGRCFGPEPPGPSSGGIIEQGKKWNSPAINYALSLPKWG